MQKCESYKASFGSLIALLTIEQTKNLHELFRYRAENWNCDCLSHPYGTFLSSYQIIGSIFRGLKCHSKRLKQLICILHITWPFTMSRHVPSYRVLGSTVPLCWRSHYFVSGLRCDGRTHKQQWVRLKTPTTVTKAEFNFWRQCEIFSFLLSHDVSVVCVITAISFGWRQNLQQKQSLFFRCSARVQLYTIRFVC